MIGSGFSNPVRSANSKKLSIDLKIVATLNEEHDKPVVEPVTTDIEEMDVDDVDDVNDEENNLDLEDEANEDVSQQNDEPQPTEDAGDVDEPMEGEGNSEGDDDQEQDLETNEVENEQENDKENEDENEEEENEEEHLPDGDLRPRELQPARRVVAVDILA
jgi:hypothetical protein